MNTEQILEILKAKEADFSRKAENLNDSEALYYQGLSEAYGVASSLLSENAQEIHAEGVREALYYLSDLYDGVEETDLWAEYVEGKTTEGEGE